MVAEHDGEGSFYTGSRVDAISGMRTKEIAKTAKMYSDIRAIPLLQEIGSPKRMARSDFWPEARKYAFLAHAQCKKARNRLLCCQIAKILATL